MRDGVKEDCYEIELGDSTTPMNFKERVSVVIKKMMMQQQ